MFDLLSVLLVMFTSFSLLIIAMMCSISLRTRASVIRETDAALREVTKVWDSAAVAGRIIDSEDADIARTKLLQCFDHVDAYRLEVYSENSSGLWNLRKAMNRWERDAKFEKRMRWAVKHREADVRRELLKSNMVLQASDTTATDDSAQAPPAYHISLAPIYFHPSRSERDITERDIEAEAGIDDRRSSFEGQHGDKAGTFVV